MTAKPIKKAVPKKVPVKKPRRKYAPGEERASRGQPEKPLTIELFNNILNHYKSGLSLEESCSLCGISVSSFQSKRDENEQFLGLYARAKPDKADKLVEIGVSLSEIEPPMRGDASGYDSAWVSWNNNRVNARFKAAALISPPTQKTELSGPGGKEPFTISVEVRK